MSHLSFHLRATTLVVLVAFCVVSLLGFSLRLDLKPAEGFLGIGDIVIDPTHIATTIAKSVEEKIWDFAKGVILAFTVTFVANMAIKMMQKLESLHVIRNMLYYSDALAFDQYIGHELNKMSGQPTNEAEVKWSPDQVNIGSIIAKTLQLPINQGFTLGQVRELAKKGTLTKDQEKEMTIGVLAMLTSQGSCGIDANQAIRNLAVYNATRVAGNASQIDPRGGVEFYEQMALLGNPYASPDFQELALRDQAAQVESRAQSAVELELTSNGLKSMRADNGVSRTSQTVADFISSSFDTALKAPLHGGAGGPAASAIGSTLALIVTQAVFNERGRLVAENPYCGIAQNSADAVVTDIYNGGDFTSGLGGGVAPNLTERYRDSTILADGYHGVEVLPIETVNLTWSVINATSNTRAFIDRKSTRLTGSRTVGPFTDNVDFRLFVIDLDFVDPLELSIASVRVLKIQCGDG